MNVFAGGYTVNETEPSFNKNNKEPLNNIEAGGGIYAPYSPEKNTEVLDNIEKKRKIDEALNSPLIDRLVEQGLLEIDEGELIKEALVNNSDIETSLNSVEGLDPKITKKVIDTIKKLNSVEKKKEGIKNFNKDFSEKIDGLKEVVEGGKKGEKELIGQNKKLIDKLGSNYIPIGGDQTQTEGLNRAFKISVNQLMDGKQFTRPEAFDDMLEVVKNPQLSFEERFNELKKIDTLINTSEGTKGKPTKAYQKMKAGVEKQKTSLEIRFNEFKEQVILVKENGNKEKAKELLIEANKLIDEADEGGDVFNIILDIDVLMHDLQDIIEYT